MPMPKLVIPDLDGTLLKNTKWFYEQGVRVLFRRFRLRCPTFQEMRDEVGNDFVEYCFQKGAPGHVDREQVREFYRASLRISPSFPPLFDDAKPFLTACRDFGAAIALVTGASQGHLDDCLRRNGLMTFFDTTAWNVKRKAETFSQLLGQFKVTPQEAIVVGDAVHDAEAATEAGIPAYICVRGLHSRTRLEKARETMPFTIVETLSEVLAHCSESVT